MSDQDATFNTLSDEVYEARAALFETTFGDLPDEVFGSFDFPAGVWPGGCLVQIAGRRPGDGVFTATFGLTDPGLLESPRSNPAGIPVRAGDAGYGFELVVCTKDHAEWPVNLLAAVARHLFEKGHDFLAELAQFGGSFIDQDLLVVPGFARVPRVGTLPNGRFLFLTVISLSPEEQAAIFARPMTESLPDVLAARVDEWIPGGFEKTSANDSTMSLVPPVTELDRSGW